MQAPGAGDRQSQHNFPAALTSFIGRVQELADLERLLGRQRLVTVVGPGGSGKTRLVVELARRLAQRFHGGAWLLELGATSETNRVADAAAGLFGVEAEVDRPLVESVAEAVGSRHLLVVMDNCEHVLDGAAELAERLLDAGEDLRILATSREALGLPGEARFALDPLAVPEHDVGADWQEWDDWDALRLFDDRAQLADRSFAMDGRTAPLVWSIVRRLAGMPLAIELAAAQLDAMDIADLDIGLLRDAGLAHRPRGASQRHLSMRASVAWSYQLLGREERRGFRRLAVFPGRFSLPAAAAALGPGSADVVAGLVRKSLLKPPRPSADGTARYRMLDPIRGDALELLGEVERAEVERDVAEWLVPEAERAAEGFMHVGRPEAAAKQWLDEEQHNVRLVLSWALEHDPHLALRLVVALGDWWDSADLLLEGHRWTERALDAGRHASPQLRAAALISEAQYHDHVGNKADALAAVKRALELVDAERDPREYSEALVWLAIELYNTEGSAASNQARALLLESLDIAKGRFPNQECGACLGLSVMSRHGDPAEALSWAQAAEAVGPGGVNGQTWRIAQVVLADALAVCGDHAGAIQVLEQNLEASRDAGRRLTEAMTLERIATNLIVAGRRRDAATPLLRSLELDLDLMAVAPLELGLAGAWAETEGPEAALVLLGAFGRFCVESGSHPNSLFPDLYDGVRDRTTKRLGRELAEHAEARGATMTTEEAVDVARKVLTGTKQPQRDLLTVRERELVALVAEGLTDVQIAEKLFISVRTVRSHLDRIRDKTGCRRRVELARLAGSAVTAG